MMCLTRSASTAYCSTDRQLRSVWTTTFATLRCTNSSPGGRSTISFAGTRLSEQPIHRYVGACCAVRREKKSGSTRARSAAQRRLFSNRSDSFGNLAVAPMRVLCKPAWWRENLIAPAIRGRAATALGSRRTGEQDHPGSLVADRDDERLVDGEHSDQGARPNEIRTTCLAQRAGRFSPGTMSRYGPSAAGSGCPSFGSARMTTRSVKCGVELRDREQDAVAVRGFDQHVRRERAAAQRIGKWRIDEREDVSQGDARVAAGDVVRGDGRVVAREAGEVVGRYGARSTVEAERASDRVARLIRCCRSSLRAREHEAVSSSDSASWR